MFKIKQYNMTIAEISHRLNQLQFNSDIIHLYNEPHRFYHTLNHIEYVLKQLKDAELLKHDELFLAAIFHDIIYNPKSNTNEEESARALREFRKQGVKKMLIGETTLTGQKVIELAGG